MLMTQKGFLQCKVYYPLYFFPPWFQYFWGCTQLVAKYWHQSVSLQHPIYLFGDQVWYRKAYVCSMFVPLYFNLTGTLVTHSFKDAYLDMNFFAVGIIVLESAFLSGKLWISQDSI